MFIERVCKENKNAFWIVCGDENLSTLDIVNEAGNYKWSRFCSIACQL